LLFTTVLFCDAASVGTSRKILAFDSIYFYFWEQSKFGSIIHRDEKLLPTKRRAQKMDSSN